MGYHTLEGVSIGGSGLVRDDRFFAMGEVGAANDALGAVATSGGAVLAAVGDDLQVELFPLLGWPEFFEVGLGLDDVFAGGEFPALGEAVDVGVDGEGGNLEGVDHDDAGGFVSNPWKLFQFLEGARYFAVEFFDEHLGECLDVLCLVVGQSAGLDAGLDFVEGEPGHFLRGVGQSEEGGGDEVDSLVGTLRGE